MVCINSTIKFVQIDYRTIGQCIFAWAQEKICLKPTQQGTALKYHELGAFIVQFSSLVSGLIAIEFTFLSLSYVWEHG